MRWLVVVLATLVASPALAFEGEIDARSVGNARGGAITFKIRVSKKRDVRMDTAMTGPEMHRASYIKPATGKYNYALDHDRKQATKIPKETVKNMAKQGQSAKGGKRTNIKVEKLGTEKVAGQMTRHVRIVDEDDGHTADVWLSDQYPASLWHAVFSAGDDKARGPSGGWGELVQRQYGVKPGFVMKVVSTGRDGTKGGIEVTRMQRKKVPTDAFKVPPGYELVEAPVMPSGMPNMKAPTTQEEAEKMRDEWMQKMKEMQEQQR